MNFLAQHGVEGKHATPNGDQITATVSFAVAEKMLRAQYYQATHTRTGTTVNRAVGGYYLPDEVAAAVDFVSPAVHIPGVSNPIRSLSASADSSLNVPKNLRELYSIGNATGKAAANKQA